MVAPSTIPTAPTTSSDWFVLTVKPQHERPVAHALAARGFEAFLPYYLAERRWSDRVKKVQVPLFPGYVFGQFELNRRPEMCTIPGYRSIVSFGGKPTPVDLQEIERIRRIVQADGLFEPHPFLKIGQSVRVTRGPLTGIEGILTQTSNSYRVVVNITILQRSVAVTLDPATVAPLSEPATPRIGAVTGNLRQA